MALPLLVGAVAPEARAADGLEWDWEVGTERVYLLQAQVRLSEMMSFKAQLNQDLRVVEFYLAAVTRCRSVAEEGKKAWELRCAFDDVQLTAAPPKIDSDRGLVDVLDEWDAAMLESELQIVFGREGKIRNVDLEGVDNRILRFREIQETIRLVCLRAFSAMDLELPKKGRYEMGEPWRQSDVRAMDLPKSVGTMGGARVDHQVTLVEGTQLTIDTVGAGVVQSGEMIGAPGQERPRNSYDLEMRGRLVFDTAKGTIVSRDYLVAGEPTASSAQATGVAGLPYVQAVHLELIPEGATVKPLGANEETIPGQSGI